MNGILPQHILKKYLSQLDTKVKCRVLSRHLRDKDLVGGILMHPYYKHGLLQQHTWPKDLVEIKCPRSKHSNI